uniref:Secreted protein n=1 Tax=Ascaris lumbricoides TaxID=6252 RepID=A0A0M3IXT6_ASCLU
MCKHLVRASFSMSSVSISWCCSLVWKLPSFSHFIDCFGRRQQR